MTTDDELIEAMAEAICEADTYFWFEATEERKKWSRMQARAALAVARPTIERALLERLVKDGTQLAEECFIQRDTGIASAVVLELKAATDTTAGGE